MWFPVEPKPACAVNKPGNPGTVLIFPFRKTFAHTPVYTLEKMLTYAPRCALLLALAAGLAEIRVESFHVPVAPAGRGAASSQGVAAAACGRIRPSLAVRGCSCGAGVATAGGLHREGPGSSARRRGDVAVGMGAEGGEAAGEFALSDNTVDVSRTLPQSNTGPR